MPIDCRSDYVGRPTPAMNAALNAALLQPSVVGLREDVHQRQLEAYAARLLGKEDALLFPTCAMANQVAIMLFCGPGDSLVAEESCHILTSEVGGPSVLARALAHPLRGEQGRMDLDDLARLLALPRYELRPNPALVVIENTHTKSGGAVLPVAYHEAVGEIVAPHGVPIHLDGARLFNASVVLGCELTAFTRIATTVTVALNKGLSAPFGAVLAGSKALIAEALRYRQMLGGGLRGTGFLAAAALEALRTMIPRLAEDHAHAEAVATGLSSIAGLTVIVPQPITNIVIVELAPELGGAQEFIAALAGRGILASFFDWQRLRLVFHRDVDDAAAATIVRTIRELTTAAA